MKSYIIEEYIPYNYKELAFRELLSLEHGVITIYEYNSKFHELIV